MSEKNKDVRHTETLERYCHVIGKNTAVCRSFSDGKEYYECMNKHNCEKCGGCKNAKFLGSKE